MDAIIDVLKSDTAQAIFNCVNLLLAIVVAIYTVVVNRIAKRHDEKLEALEKRRLTIDAYQGLMAGAFTELIGIGEPSDIEANVRRCMEEARDKTIQEREKKNKSDYLYWVSRIPEMKEYQKIIGQIDALAKCLFPDEGEPIYDWDVFKKMVGNDMSKYYNRLNGYFKPTLKCDFKRNPNDNNNFEYCNKSSEAMKKLLNKMGEEIKY